MKHPAAQDALRYIKSRPKEVLDAWGESFLLDEDEIANHCHDTLKDIFLGVRVEDIDILGLAYVMKQGECG